jgi:cytochrome b6-f complex iron-sulfur subunit
MNAPAPALNRREFLSYIWAASMALFTAETIGAVIWITGPRYGPAKDCFTFCYLIFPQDLPGPDRPPIKISYPNWAGFWLVNVGPKTTADARHPPGVAVQPGILALYSTCPHLGCQYQWNDSVELFVCPCHGSAFLRDGTRVHGPAARDLDKFLVTAADSNGNVLAQTSVGYSGVEAGQPVPLPDGTMWVGIENVVRISGQFRDGPNTIK